MAHEVQVAFGQATADAATGRGIRGGHSFRSLSACSPVTACVHAPSPADLRVDRCRAHGHRPLVPTHGPTGRPCGTASGQRWGSPGGGSDIRIRLPPRLHDALRGGHRLNERSRDQFEGEGRRRHPSFPGPIQAEFVRVNAVNLVLGLTVGALKLALGG